MSAQMKPHSFGPCDPISVTGFLKSFELACDTNRVHEGTAVCLFHLFMNKTASAVLNAHLSAERSDKKNSRLVSGKTKDFPTCPQVVNSLLKKCTTDKVVAETKFKITLFVHPSGLTSSQYTEELVTKNLRYGDAYEEYVLNKIFMEGLDTSIVPSMRKYWEGKKKALTGPCISCNIYL